MDAQNALLPGEGETKVTTHIRRRQCCENCGEPATLRFSFCYVNGRRNPASSMYGRDDCTYCSDANAFACSDCEGEVRREACPNGMDWAGTHTLGQFNSHMFLYWAETKSAA